MTPDVADQPDAGRVFELTAEQEAALSAWTPPEPDLNEAPEHVVLDLSPEAAARFHQTVPTDTVRAVAVRLWVIGTGTCAICETPIDILLRHPHPASAQVDHILPQSRGGGDHWGNLRVTHRQCNMERNDALTHELAPARAQELLAAAVYRHEHPGAFLPGKIELERGILEMLAGFVAETRAALTEQLQARRPNEHSIDFLQKELARREKNLTAQERKVARLTAKLNALTQ